MCLSEYLKKVIVLIRDHDLSSREEDNLINSLSDNEYALFQDIMSGDNQGS